MAAGKGNQDGVEAGTADKEGSTDVSTAANQELENTSENRLIQYIRVKWGGASNGLAWWSMHPNIP